MKVDAYTLQVLDAFVKSFQILFFIVAGVCTVLTYRGLKRGWLNSVNTEYQKKVIERLSTVAEELASEFNTDSPNHWSKFDPVKELLETDNVAYLNDPERYKEHMNGGPYINTEYQKRLRNLTQTYKTDPFLPRHIRETIVDLLQNREDVTRSVYMETLDDYREWLKKEPVKNQKELEYATYSWHNKANKSLYERGCGISDIETEVNAIRLVIQQYFESFSPVRTHR